MRALARHQLLTIHSTKIEELSSKETELIDEDMMIEEV